MAKFLYYIKYMKINYPAQLLHYFQNHSTASIQFGIKQPDFDVEENPLPPNFALYKLSSRYINNNWETFITLIIIMGLGFFFTLVYSITKKYNIAKLKNFLGTVVLIFRWNLFLLIFLSSLDEITLYSILELRTFSINRAGEFFSFFLILLSIALALYLFIMQGYISYKF
mmetsp:Transcript_41530/g.36881  ORF Transcript_41530/g.36881 Transcript_41530/m.36881 type:complete len:170 (-) Transcript_41530:1750-2259(-)